MIQLLLIDMQPVGSLRVFALLTQMEHELKASYDNKIFWTDSKASTPQGPYPTVYNAIESYKAVILSRRNLKDSEEQIPLENIAAFASITDIKSNILDLDKFRAARPKKHW